MGTLKGWYVLGEELVCGCVHVWVDTEVHIFGSLPEKVLDGPLEALDSFGRFLLGFDCAS